MQEKDIDNQPAQWAWAAARDARMRSYSASTGYTDSQKLQGERMKLALEMLYSAKGIHLNFRERFIALKVDQPTVKNRRALAQFEKDWTDAGVSKRVSAQGIIYRIPKV
jgi:predicted chitinase